MRTTRGSLSSLALAALCAGTPAAAQRAATTTRPRAEVPGDAGIAAAPTVATVAARPLAAYRLTGVRNGELPVAVTVADSAGQLVASYRLADGHGARPLLVSVIDTDLVLQGETPAGLLTLQLFRQNDPDFAGAVAGRWWLGTQRGSLRGRPAR